MQFVFVHVAQKLETPRLDGDCWASKGGSCPGQLSVDSLHRKAELGGLMPFPSLCVGTVLDVDDLGLSASSQSKHIAGF